MTPARVQRDDNGRVTVAPREQLRRGSARGRGALAAVPDSVIDELFLIGSPAEIRSGVADYVRAGITIPVLAVLGPDQESIRKLAMELGRPGAARS